MMPKHAGPAPPIGPPADRSSDPERPVASARPDTAAATPRSLVVVSNRLPFTVERRPEGVRFRRSPGGLVTALEPALAQRGGVWVGWTGAADASDDEALVWVHDYQLLRVPHHLRRLAPRRRIAFFLHIPFPAADVLRVLPWSRDLIQGMLAADLVGVHIRSYADHVLTCAERLLGCVVDRGEGLVRFEGRRVSDETHSISI